MNLIVVMGVVLVIAIIFNGFLLFRDIRRKLASPEGRKIWEKQKKFAVYNGVIAFICNFADVFGIGSYATTSALSKIRGSIDDENIPGTLNVGDTIPVALEALLFLELVQLDTLTFIGMVGAAVLGSAVGASVVTKWDRGKVRYGMGVGLLIVGLVMICRQAGIGPFGLTGTATMLRGWKLIVAVVVCFVLGALMNLGIGMYAPCMALVLLLGMNVQAAFPIMFGSCAYLMAFGSTPKFIKESRYDMVATLENAILGGAAVLIAYYLVKSLDLNILIWIVVVVVFITAGLFLKDAVTKKA